MVKVVARADGMALYFSRAPIPWDRDAAANRASGRQPATAAAAAISGCTRIACPRCSRSRMRRRSRLERRERLEQLRALALGLAIVVADAEALPGPGVDTPDDLARADALLREAGRQ